MLTGASGKRVSKDDKVNKVDTKWLMGKITKSLPRWVVPVRVLHGLPAASVSGARGLVGADKTAVDLYINN